MARADYTVLVSGDDDNELDISAACDDESEGDDDEESGYEESGYEESGYEESGAAPVRRLLPRGLHRMKRKSGGKVIRVTKKPADRYDTNYAVAARSDINNTAPANVLTFRFVGPLGIGRHELKDTIPEYYVSRSLIVNPKFGTNVGSFDMTVGGVPISGNDATFYAPSVFLATSFNRTIEGKDLPAGGVVKVAINLETALLAGEVATITLEGIRAGMTAGRPASQRLR